MTVCIFGAPMVRAAHTLASSRVALLALVALLVGPLAACGKKGPPLAPLLRIPAPAESLSARRLGDTVYVQLTIPGKNQDNSTPADVARVDVYGYTGTAASDDDLIKYGTLVASVPVRKPPAEDERRDEQASADKPKGELAARKAPKPDAGFDQGATVTVTETLTAALLAPVARPQAKAPAAVPALAQAATKAVSQAVTRIYAAVGINHKGRRGSVSRRVAVPVEPAPAPPADLKVTFSESQITLAWTAPPMPAASPASNEQEQAPPAAAAVQPPSLAYNVYAVSAPSSAPATGTAAAVATESAPRPLNDKPLAVPTFSDSRIEFGTERCYVVRAVATVGALQAESATSAVGCVLPKDIFPPAAPKGLTVVTSTGAVNLLWEPNTEGDLAGYLVLRGEAPGVTLQPITAQPIRETTFNDTTVKAGVRYVYAVVAVDKAGNIGAQSNKVEETGR